MKHTSRLIEQFAPSNYQLELDINAEQLTFSGHVAITGELPDATNTILLHASQLDITAAIIGDDELAIAADEDWQTVTLTATEPLAGEQRIELTFTGRVTPTMHGLYYSDYQDGDLTKRMISTQFESHHAREVFPCIDEPTAKATFDLTLITDLPALSNTPESTLGQLDDGRVKTTFERTPRMSTYLLALVSGELGQIEAHTNRGTLVRTFAPIKDVDYLKFALDTAVGCLEFYEDYFGIEYPLEKCDMVSIPEFAAGAMENWGLITYRETALLVDESNTSLANKQMVAHVIAHELAHQWFGNLVTMEWWDDLWLNEGFASWIENMAVDHLYPDWQVWTEFVAGDYQAGLSIDSLDSSHPIVQQVHDPREINEIFDTVTYRKGPSIIRMLHDYLGAGAFRTGLQQYLKKHAYGNATTADLWQSLSAVSNHDVGQFMKDWTTSRGYPLITADGTTLTQQQFLEHPDKQPSDVIWPVPLHDGSNSLLLDTSTLQLEVDELPLTLNPNQSSFVRVAYNSKHYQRLADELVTDTLTTAERVGLISDVFAIAMNGTVSTTDGLQLIKRINTEPSNHVWETIGGELAAVRTHLLGDVHQQLMEPMVSDIVSANYQRLSWKPVADESETDRLIRPTIIALALRYDLFDAPAVARKLWDGVIAGNNTIPPDLRSSVYSYITRTGSDSYDQLLELYEQQTLNEEKLRFARALTAFEDSAAANRSLELIQTDKVRQQDVITWLVGLLRNPHSRQITWDWYRQNWDWLQQQFGHGHIYSYLAQILGLFSKQHYAAEIRSFFKDKDTTGLELSLEQAIESIETVAAWIERDSEPVRDWLRKNV